MTDIDINEFMLDVDDECTVIETGYNVFDWVDWTKVQKMFVAKIAEILTADQAKRSGTSIGYKAGLIAAAEAECIWCRKGRELADGMHGLTGSASGQWVPCKAQATLALLEKTDGQ